MNGLKCVLYKIISLCILLLYTFHASGESYQSNTDSLLSLLNSAKHDTEKVLVYINLCGILTNSYPDSAFQYGLKGIDLATKSNDKKEIAACLTIIGNFYYSQGDYTQALNYYNKSYVQFDELRKSPLQYEATAGKKGIASCHLNFGIVNAQQGKYPQALEKKSVAYTAQNEKKSGEKIWVQTTLTPIVDYSGNISKLIAIDSDITKIKDAEEQIRTKSELLAKTNTELENKNMLIMDSISYAKLIQDAILPSSMQFKATFSDSFVFYRPRDIVSGDFYWLCEKNNFTWIALVDCTGHGVPGAFMSMIGNTLLNELVSENTGYTPAVILGKLDEKVQFALGQGGDSITKGDGMDISLCRIDKSKNELLLACANQTVFLYTPGGEVKEITGNRFSIGTIFRKKRNMDFTDYPISLEKETTLYLFSDGFTDQFSENNSRKYTVDRLKNLLTGIQSMDMPQQLICINSAFDEWIGDNRQFDDVTVIGLKI